MDKNDFNTFLASLEIYLPDIKTNYPDLLLSIYQCWLLLYKSMGMSDEFEELFSKYIIPLCLQCPEQMHQLKTKQLYSYLGNSNMIIGNTARFKKLVEQYTIKVLLLINTVIVNGNSQKQTNAKDNQSQIDMERLVLNQIETQMVELFQISNPIEYFLNKKTASSTSFDSIIFNEKQIDEVYSPLGNLAEIDLNDSNEAIISSTPITYINDPYSNYNIYSKHPLKKFKELRMRLESKNPFIKHFHPKFLKKENIDKKILRRFRAYIKETNQKSPNYLKQYEETFWNDFSKLNLLPPMRYTSKRNKIIEFKSFNTKYYLWLFAKNGAVELFNTFVKEKGNDFINETIKNYDSEYDFIADKLRDYLIQIPRKYSKQCYNKNGRSCIDNSNSTCCLTQKDSSEDDNEKGNAFDIDIPFDNTKIILNNNSEVEDNKMICQPYGLDEENEIFTSEGLLLNDNNDDFNFILN